MKNGKLWQLLVAVALVLVGCRTTEIMTTRMVFPKGTDLGKLPAITVNNVMYGCGIDVEQGKTVESSLAPAVAASVAATLRDIQASQSGALNRQDSPSGNSENAAPAAVVAPTVQGGKPVAQDAGEKDKEGEPARKGLASGTEGEAGIESPVVDESKAVLDGKAKE